MGATPLTALAVLCFPDAELAARGAARDPARRAKTKMREAGVSVLGGHSVRDPELKFGYAVTGVAAASPAAHRTPERAPGDRGACSPSRSAPGSSSTALKHGNARAGR